MNSPTPGSIQLSGVVVFIESTTNPVEIIREKGFIMIRMTNFAGQSVIVEPIGFKGLSLPNNPEFWRIECLQEFHRRSDGVWCTYKCTNEFRTSSAECEARTLSEAIEKLLNFSIVRDGQIFVRYGNGPGVYKKTYEVCCVPYKAPTDPWGEYCDSAFSG